MCGIHFALSCATTQPGFKKFIEDAFLANQVRGVDSAGVFRVGIKAGQASRFLSDYKSAVAPTAFIKHHAAAAIISTADTAAATIGHVRHATQGAVTRENAHPFRVRRDDGSELIGVHNGSLRFGWKSMDEGDEYAVDSEWMFNKLAADGLDAFKGFDGAFVLVWYDTKTPDVIHIAKNKERPLFVAWTKDRKGMIGASELGMLGWLADRDNIELWSDDKKRSMFFMANDRHYTVSLNDMQLVDHGPIPKFLWTTNPYKTSTTRYDDDADWVYHNYDASYGTRYRQNYSRIAYEQDGICNAVLNILEQQKQLLSKPAPTIAKDNPQLPEVKKLIKATERVLRGEDLVDGADIAAIEAVAKEHLRPGSRHTFAETVPSASASAQEIALAKELGYYGLVGRADAYWYEDGEQAIYSGFHPGKKKITKSGEWEDGLDSRIRHIKASMHSPGGAYSEHNLPNLLFAVIGARITEGKPASYLTLILSAVGETSARFVERRLELGDIAQRAGASVN